MQRMVTYQGWAPLAPDESIEVAGSVSIFVRSESAAFVYASAADDFADELLVGYGVGEQEVTLKAEPCRLRIKSEGRVWVRETARAQTRRRIDPDVFTTLDRPPPLSPEMLAIQKMMRRNEIERERHRAEIEGMINDRRASETTDASTADTKAQNKAAGKRGANKATSDTDAAERQGDKEPPVSATGESDGTGGKDTE